ncbi:hypothetical protein HHK36_005458 [Tetracentron sinense]|uniref:Uncharacterized protein n=1 Tax=Tetracentron sinense TaxID=13715 RepID=A0A835DMB5_TETSI|nr:hypothetical protein HHK36_005458 [Tetracentron sinense]
MKIGAKDKFLLCFRPVVMEGAIDSDRNVGSGNPLFTYIAVADKGNLMIPAILSSLPEKTSMVPAGETKVPEGETVDRRRKRKARKLLSQILKAVVFESSLRKKTRNKKDQQNSSYRSKCNLSAKNDKISDVTDEESVHRKLEDDDRKTVPTGSSQSSSSSFSSSCSSSVASTSQISESKNSRSLSERKKSCRSNSFEPKQNNSVQELGQKPKKMVAGYYSGLYLLLISLSVMVFWGRVCAVLCTATWLYFVSRWDSGDEQPENVIKSPEINSREYKKKVIMEGLLERNHRRGQ